MRHDPEGVAESVRLCVARPGWRGLSIEDSTGDKAKPLHDLDLAVARIEGGARGDRPKPAATSC